MSYSTRVLFLVLEGELIGIDYEKLIAQRDWATVSIPTIASIYFKENLCKKEVLVGMKHFTIKSEVYLVGGEKLKFGSNPNKNYVAQNPESYVNSSNQVIHLERKKNKNFNLKKRNSTVQELQYGKCCPIVENIEGKIYVLEGKSYFKPQNPHTYATFETCQPNGQSWRTLSNPPPYRSEPKGEIRGHFVLGHKLFIVCHENQVYFFDTRIEEWNELGTRNMMFSSFENAQISLPFNGVRVPYFPDLNNDKYQLIISRPGIEEAYALLMDSTSGSLLFYQPLHNIFRRCYPITTETGDRVHLNKGRNFFVVRSCNEILAIWAAFDHHRKLRLFITMFTIDLLSNPLVESSSSFTNPSYPVQTKFLRVINIFTQDCIVAKEETSSNHVFDVFLYNYEKYDPSWFCSC